MELRRQEMRLTGIVQGVGMRPFVANAATRRGLTGFVGNDERGVFIQVQGTGPALDEYFRSLLVEKPALAQIWESSREFMDVVDGEEGFVIRGSEHVGGERTLIPPDTSMCEDCLKEFNDPGNRRYKYPFTTCTNCGPRLSIITDLPYDRPLTTMSQFDMCDVCAHEYADPADRRYHAQPISCPSCGPKLWLHMHETANKPDLDSVDREHQLVCDQNQVQAIVAAVHQAWDEGKTIAVKGIGGYHLMCDATNATAVARLRSRKHRPDKPLAVMARDAARLGQFSQEELEILQSPARPIVTVPVDWTRTTLAREIAPGLDKVGFMLPYSPLHELIVDRPLVATSANLSGEPVVYTEYGLQSIQHMCDGWLAHDREIYVPDEDSVFSGTAPVRRSRGLAPLPVQLTMPAGEAQTVLAVGGELKNTCTLAIGDKAHISAHVGDMGSLAAQQNLDRAVAQLIAMRGQKPDVVACDLHPNYSTTAWAERFADKLGVPLVQVQHHHAHALSLLADRGLVGKRAVIATLDGTGYGTDGSIWGGEILGIAEDGSFERLWHVPPFPLAGGDKAVRNPWRSAMGLMSAWKIEGPEPAGPADEKAFVRMQLKKGVGTAPTSSLGRVFDAAAAILGVCTEVSYEGQAAMELEALARRAPEAPEQIAMFGHEIYSFETLMAWLVEWAGTHDLSDPLQIAPAAELFHERTAEIIGKQLATLSEELGTDHVGVTGGCAVNDLFLDYLDQTLGMRGLELLVHKQVPATDGGLSLGQAVAARLGVSN